MQIERRKFRFEELLEIGHWHKLLSDNPPRLRLEQRRQGRRESVATPLLATKGLTYLANASYGSGRPDLRIDQEFLHYWNKCFCPETGLSSLPRARTQSSPAIFGERRSNGSFLDMPNTSPSAILSARL
jgi:hypothetical protein